MANTKTCLACGKKYDFCPRCRNGLENPWMVSFDCTDCKEIFNVVSGYNIGVSTIADVKVVMDKLNISDVEVYQGAVKDVLLKAKEPEKAATVDVELEEKQEVKARFSKGISK